MDPLRLENQLCFPLYAAARSMVKLYTPFLNEIGLTYTQYITMMVMWEKKSVGVKALGESLYLDSGTLTPLLKKLEQNGLVSRHRSKEDERNLIVEITEKGDSLRQRALKVPEQMRKCVTLSTEDAVALYKLLNKMLDQLKN
ncbi:MAG: MarR family transcriptional regulator [Clostridiales bacterium]|jgi:DNA-binding MarR family transcriptional regulator|nr:MarR family transcriptional regulator [Clostridiales bacterium]